MELDKRDKIFLGACLTLYLLVMSYVGIFAPEDFVRCLILSVFASVIAFIVGYIVA